jgi:glycerol-3-phosphate dehydrogenase
MDLLRPLADDTGVLEAEVPWAARKELALSVDDFLARRTRLALLLRDHGTSVAPRVAQLLAPELGWSTEAAARSAAAYVSSAPREYGLPGPEPR